MLLKTYVKCRLRSHRGRWAMGEGEGVQAAVTLTSCNPLSQATQTQLPNLNSDFDAAKATPGPGLASQLSLTFDQCGQPANYATGTGRVNNIISICR